MSFRSSFIIWLVVNAVCLWTAILWAEEDSPSKFPRTVDPLAAAIIVPICCALGAGVLLLGYMTWLTISLWWDTALLRLISFMIRNIPRDTKSQVRRRFLTWATERLSKHVKRWLSTGAP